ncbi:hypothetical protein MW887_004778 [Aspergillus wentii]|nr:hypothetical protein MW887_004778 [Aspergillus wentii]
MDPSTMQLIQTLSAEANSSLSGFQSSASESARIDALEKVLKLARALEKPRDAILKLGFSPTYLMAVKVAIDLKIFSILANATLPVGLDELAAAKPADPLLVERIMRLLCQNGFAQESAPCEYIATAISKEMTQRTSIGVIESLFLELLPAIQKTPEYLELLKYQNPSDPNFAPLQYAHNFRIDSFQWLCQNPEIMTRFNTFMEGQRAGRAHWGDWYPVRERILNADFKPDQALLVDIGGGRGHDILEFKKRFPDVSAKYVLAELPGVLEDAEELDADIQKLPYDFWTTEQPIKGARVYYFKMVFHDWADEKARIILNNIKASMEKGYSKIVVEEYIVADMNAGAIHGITDIGVMVFCSGLERTRQRWASLFESVGLQTTFWAREGDGLGIIEAELPN